MEDSESLIRFNKRRKVYRRREDEPENINVSNAINGATQSHPHDSNDDNPAAGFTSLEALSAESPATLHDGAQSSEDIRLAELLRRRKQAKAKRGGIEFSNSASNARSDHSVDGLNTSRAISHTAPTADAPSALDAAQARFSRQTGAITDDTNNRHMMSYIDSEMAKLRAGVTSNTQSGNGESKDASESGVALNLRSRQPAALGQIQEIDLGPDSAMRNVAMTEEATRRLQNGQPVGEDESRSQEVRLGRDGKPRRPKKRRGSNDLKRDEVVEAVLHENKLGLYDESSNQQPNTQEGDGNFAAADDVIAEQFQRDFLEAIQSRNRMRRPPANTSSTAAKKGAKGAEEKSRGPKLGGSRSARAAMHAAERARSGKR